MLTIEVELLGGRYAATAHNDRSQAEWPPHPARLFSALVAALHDNEPEYAIERDALLWLEKQAPPSLDVDLDDAVGRRDVLDVYVPVNDISLVGDLEKPLRDACATVVRLDMAEKTPETTKELKQAKKVVERENKKLTSFLADQQVIDPEPSAKALATSAALLPGRRTRQVRTFPVVFPSRRCFAISWSSEPPAPMRAALDRLCERVTRLGHSSSLVRCAIVERVFTPTLVPDPNGDTVLRTVSEGQVAHLEEAFTRHRSVQYRVLPALPQRYGRPQVTLGSATCEQSVFSEEWIIFERVDGAHPMSSRTTDLTQALRRALIEQHGSRTLPESLSGHRQDGPPADNIHVAFVALPFVGHDHADGSVKGCAIVLPRAMPAPDREALLRLIGDWERDRGRNGIVELAGGTLPPVRFRRIELPSHAALRIHTWCKPARRFVTATPIGLDRNPGNLRSNFAGTAYKAATEAQRLIADACVRIGLPAPVSVEVTFDPLLPGAQPARSFLPWPNRPGRPPRVRVHADIYFGESVRGPVLIGAGRFFGLGLCRPVLDQESR